MADITKDDVIEFIANMSVLDLSELVKVGLLRARVSGSHVYYRLQRRALDKFCQSMAGALHSGKKKS